MWQVYVRYHNTEGTRDEISSSEPFATLSEAREYASDLVYEDFEEYEAKADLEDEDYVAASHPRFPGNWSTIGPEDVVLEEGAWYDLPPDDTMDKEVSLVYAHLHSQYDWTFRDDYVLFYAKRV